VCRFSPSTLDPWLPALLWLLLGSGSMPLHGQATFSGILTNGPAANRFNIVFLSEGYTSGQLAQFLVAATNAANLLLTNQPFAEYRPYFNACAIAVPSAESGSDHPAWPSYQDTYFNSTYGYSDYIMSMPPDDFDTNYNHGQGKVDALLNTYMPACDLAVLLVNDLSIGGSDGGGRTAIAAVSSSLGDILLHECGHVVAGLGDEYTTAYPGFPDVEEPNTTRETNRAAIKWNAWISTNTPVPTPPTAQYAEVVGLFEGAHYHTNGWYRPRLNCRMASPFTQFYCEVCSESLVLSLYRKVRPIDFFTPAATNLSVTSTQPLSFTLTVLQPAAHALRIQWLTNGTAMAGATNSVLTLLPAELGNGTHTVAGQVSDLTPLVRTDPSNLLSQTLTWTVTVNLPQLQLSAPRWLEEGKFTFRINGVAPQGFAIHASTNLSAWTSITTNSLVNGQFDYTNQDGDSFSARMFRAVTPP
jgi:hypothetical protein